VRDELGRVTALLASAAIDSHAGYLVTLHLAKRGQDAEHYQGLKQAARLTARETVSRRVSRQGLEQLADLLQTLIASDRAGDGAAAVSTGASGAPSVG
jgi:hypothetical protein